MTYHFHHAVAKLLAERGDLRLFLENVRPGEPEAWEAAALWLLDARKRGAVEHETAYLRRVLEGQPRGVVPNWPKGVRRSPRRRKQDLGPRGYAPLGPPDRQGEASPDDQAQGREFFARWAAQAQGEAENKQEPTVKK